MKRTAFIAIVGRPNVGKSTLLNDIMGEKIAIISKKPQTTRNAITGILTRGQDQFVFMDTPGLHNPRTRLGDYMVKSVNRTIGGVDSAILVCECGTKPNPIELKLIDTVKQSGMPCILVINKTDRSNPVKLAETIEAFSSVYAFDAVVPVSALKNKGVDIVLDEASKFLYESEWFFPEDAVTDQPERQIASEIIREKLLRTLDDEIPHGTAVVIESFEESEKLLSVRAEIFCEKQSHKGIIIGKNGATLKLIGTRAREDMEAFFGTKVYLDLWVKVKENWRDSVFNLANFGYNEKNLDQ